MAKYEFEITFLSFFILQQRRDDEKWISLTKNINTIFYYYGRDPEVAGGGAVDHSDPDIKAATEERNNNK